MKKYRESVPSEDQDGAYVDFVRKQRKLDKKKAMELDHQINADKTKTS